MVIGGLSAGHTVTAEGGAKYRVIQELGSGGNCRVYLAIAVSGEHHGVLFALKIFLRTDDAKRLERFETESAFLAAHSHPSIMRVYDRGTVRLSTAGDYQQYPFAVADYYTATLDMVYPRMRLADKIIHMMQLLSGLKYLSNISPKIVHRDIKPKNIFVRGRGCALGDFGLMKALSSNTIEDDGAEVLLASEGPGMPRAYRTPDLVRYALREAPITPASDIFQLGLVGAEMFTGRNPLKRASNRTDPIDMEAIGDVPGSLGKNIQDALRRMLVLDPVNREEILPLLEQWESIFQQAVSTYDQLERRVF